MFLESSPSESFIKSSSLSELELQSFVEEKTQVFLSYHLTSKQVFHHTKSFFQKKIIKVFQWVFRWRNQVFLFNDLWISYYPQEICSYPHRLYEASLSLKKKSFTNIFFLEKKSKSFVTINVFLIKEIPVFHNPGIIICYGKEKNKQNSNQEMNSTREKKAKPQQNWTSKLCETGTVKSRLENKKTKSVWVLYWISNAKTKRKKI